MLFTSVYYVAVYTRKMLNMKTIDNNLLKLVIIPFPDTYIQGVAENTTPTNTAIFPEIARYFITKSSVLVRNGCLH